MKPLTDAMLERIAGQFRALSEPSRLRLMSLLFDAERSVGELTEASGLGLANVSKHLAVLHAAGFVRRRKEGVRAVYGLADERARALCDLMCRRVEEQARAEAWALAGGGAGEPGQQRIVKKEDRPVRKIMSTDIASTAPPRVR